MYGYAVAGDSELEKYDIPRGKVFGVGKKSGQEGYEIKMNDVGLEDMFVVRNGKLYYRDPVHE